MNETELDKFMLRTLDMLLLCHAATTEDEEFAGARVWRPRDNVFEVVLPSGTVYRITVTRDKKRKEQPK